MPSTGPDAEQIKGELAETLAARGLPPLADPGKLKRRAGATPADPPPWEDETADPRETTSGMPDGVTPAMIKALRRAGWCAIVGLGLGPAGPLRLATSSDPAKTLREARMHNLGIGEAGVHFLIYLPGPEVATRVRDDVLDVLRIEGGVIRASLVSASASRLNGLVRASAGRIGTDAVDARTAARAAEEGL